MILKWFCWKSRDKCTDKLLIITASCSINFLAFTSFILLILLYYGIQGFNRFLFIKFWWYLFIIVHLYLKWACNPENSVQLDFQTKTGGTNSLISVIVTMRLLVILLSISASFMNFVSSIGAIGETQPKNLLWADEFEFLDETKWLHLVTTYPLVSLF